MMDTTIENWDMDIIEDLLSLENSYDLDLRMSDSSEPIDDIFNNFASDTSPVSDEPSSSINSTEDISHNIPTDPKEWLVTDQISRRQRPPRLYEFLILLLHKSHYRSYASYKNEALGVFEISEPDKVADLWQQVKNRQSHQKMTYDKFARAIRWYYKPGIMTKTNARYTFQFSRQTLANIIIDENNNIIINAPVTINHMEDNLMN